MSGIFLQFFRQQIRQARDGGVRLHAAPVAPAAAGERLAGDAEQVQRRGHVAGFHAVERVAVERESVRAHERRAQAGARHEHGHRGAGLAARELRLGHAAVIAVVAHDERQRAARLGSQRRAVIGPHVPAVETRRQVWRLAENAIAFVGSRNRQAHTRDLRPEQIVLRQKIANARDPAADDSRASLLGIGGPLQNLGAHHVPLAADGGEFGGGGAAVGAHKYHFAHAVGA